MLKKWTPRVIWLLALLLPVAIPVTRIVVPVAVEAQVAPGTQGWFPVQTGEGAASGPNYVRYDTVSARPATTNSPSVTTTAITTTVSVNLITVKVLDIPVSIGAAGTLTDSKGNSYTLGARASNASFGLRASIWYCYNPGSYGSGHTFSYTTGATTSYPTIQVATYGGASASPAGSTATAYNTASSTTISTGALTPTVSGALIESAWGTAWTGVVSPTISGGCMTSTEQLAWFPWASSRQVNSAFYALIQGSAASCGVTYTYGAAPQAAAATMIFN